MVSHEKWLSLPPPCPRGARQLGGKGAGRSFLSSFPACDVDLLCRSTPPWSITTASPYDVRRWACSRAAENKQMNPGGWRRPKLQPTVGHDPNELPCYARDTILMPGDNTSAVQWVFKRRGGKETRSGALVHLLGCWEVGSGWCFDALHVAGEENTIAGGIPRWKPEAADGNLRTFRPDVAWRRKVLGSEGVALCS